MFKWRTPLGNPYNHDVYDDDDNDDDDDDDDTDDDDDDDDDDDNDDTDDAKLSQTLTSIFLVQNIHGIVGGELCLSDCLRGKS